MEKELQITVGEVQYLLIPHKENFLKSHIRDDPTLTLVYTAKPGEKISSSVLRDFRINLLDRDDVFQAPFYSNVVFYGTNEDELDPSAYKELAAWNTKTIAFMEASSEIAPGPYVVTKEWTWQPWRVYRDFNATFMFALDAPQAGTAGRVIVPSRCYYKPSSSRPLDGARISVKDNIDIAGHKTTLCNRAWQDLYPAKTKHAACVQVLIDAGAVIVGKAKLQAMIMREEPLEAVEFTAPFNPRGDGYQVPSGSSHGSAAGIGSYECLDFSIGSDMQLPVKILYPKDYLPTPNAAQSSLIDRFVEGLETALRVRREEISLAELWKQDCPDGQDHSDIAEYLKLTGGYPYYRDAYLDLSDFRNDYEKKFGKPPFVHRAMHWQWDIAKTISLEERDLYWRRSEIYRNWLLKRVFKADLADSVAIMVFPIEVGKPNYRDAELPSTVFYLEWLFFVEYVANDAGARGYNHK
ncbi:amidase [Emydomyces testavorans]|uniref:Amidase n=1 Tax=Emydomyces testavorans TaxID=2070801 RepID=A0AAF0DGL5_9EURO|nr:amidase [Emydomyces testavorans]